MHVIATDISVWINEIADETSKALTLELEKVEASESLQDCAKKLEQVVPGCREYEMNKTDLQVQIKWNTNPVHGTLKNDIIIPILTLKF